MRRIALLAVVTVVACGDDGSGVADGAVDGPPIICSPPLRCSIDAQVPDANVDGGVIVDASNDASPIGADAMTAVRTFTQGAAGYMGTQDTTLQAAQPSAAFGNLTIIGWDADGTYGLLRFTNIFGSDASQVPAGATIVSATLTITLANDSDLDAALHEVLVDWDEATTTYNSLGATPGVTAGEDYNATVVAAVPPTGTFGLDVTSSVAAWSTTPASNRGWLFRTDSTDGAAASSSEATTARPTLTITYTQ